MRHLRQYIRQILLEVDCWDGYAPGAQGGPKTKKGTGKNKGKRVNNCEKIEEYDEEAGKELEEADSINKDRMKCNKPRYLKKGEPGYGNKQKVVKACDPDTDKEKLQKFGDAKMRNNRDKPKNKKSFRARHNCSDKNLEDDWDTASYWACKDW